MLFNVIQYFNSISPYFCFMINYLVAYVMSLFHLYLSVSIKKIYFSHLYFFSFVVFHLIIYCDFILLGLHSTVFVSLNHQVLCNTLKGVSSPKILYCENVIYKSCNKTSYFFLLKKINSLSFWLSGFKTTHLLATTVTSQNQNCCIPKPQPLRLLTVLDLGCSSSGLKMSQLWPKDVQF